MPNKEIDLTTLRQIFLENLDAKLPDDALEGYEYFNQEDFINGFLVSVFEYILRRNSYNNDNDGSDEFELWTDEQKQLLIDWYIPCLKVLDDHLDSAIKSYEYKVQEQKIFRSAIIFLYEDIFEIYCKLEPSKEKREEAETFFYGLRSCQEMCGARGYHRENPGPGVPHSHDWWFQPVDCMYLPPR